jgi:hypothetical protein
VWTEANPRLPLISVWSAGCPAHTAAFGAQRARRICG